MQVVYGTDERGRRLVVVHDPNPALYAALKRLLKPFVQKATAPADMPVAPRRRASSSHLLTPRERDVQRLVLKGHSSSAIAEELGVSIRTVEAHRLHIIRKAGVRALGKSASSRVIAQRRRRAARQARAN